MGTVRIKMSIKLNLSYHFVINVRYSPLKDVNRQIMKAIMSPKAFLPHSLNALKIFSRLKVLVINIFN